MAKDRNPPVHAYTTQAVYDLTVNKFLDWLGSREITPATVQEFDDLNPRNKRTRISAIRQYCRKHNIADPYSDTVIKGGRHASCDPTLIKPASRKVYANQIKAIKNFCGADIITEAHLNAYIESRRGDALNFKILEARLVTSFNWYKACIEQGLSTDPIIPEQKQDEDKGQVASPEGDSSLLLYSDRKKPLNARVNLKAVAERCELQFGTVEGYLRRVSRFQTFTGSDKITPEGWQWFVKKACGSASSVAREKQALGWYCQDNGLPLPFEFIDGRTRSGRRGESRHQPVEIKRRNKPSAPPCARCHENSSNPNRGDDFGKLCNSCYEQIFGRTSRESQRDKYKQVRRAIALPPAQKIDRNAISSTTSWRRQS